MSWWSDGSSPASARVLRGPRVSATRPTSFLVDPSKHKPPAQKQPEPEEEKYEEDEEFEVEIDTGAAEREAGYLAEIDRLKADHETALEAANNESFEKGYAAAVEELAAKARETEALLTSKVDMAAAALEAAVRQVEERREEAVVVVEQEASELAFKLTRALVGRETALSENPTIDSIKRALALTPTNDAVKIRLNPDDIATLAGYDMTELGRECTIIGDESVEHSGCIVEVGATTIDSQMGQAMGRVRKVLLGMHGSHDDDPATAGAQPNSSEASKDEAMAS